MNRFFIETYGCQMNISDSAEIKQELEKNGWKESEDLDSAQLVLINTCSVRKTAEQRILGRLGFYKKQKALRPLLLVIMGCFAQRDGKNLKEKYPFIDFVIGTRNKKNIAQILTQKISSENLYNTMENTFDFLEPAPDPLFPQRALIPIIKGCNNYCSYCIVPYVRGQEISLPSKTILENIKKLVDKGVKEFFLLGQNVNSYGKDNQDISFASLLQKIIQIPGVQRVKFLTSHPKDFTDELIETITASPIIAQSVHLPLQSASHKILQKMNRKYDFEHYYLIIEKLRKKNPLISLSTDILVGFPGEEEQDFLATRDAVEKIQFDKAFVFMYSPREGTFSATHFQDNVEMREKKRRIQEILKLQQNITKQKLKRFLNQVQMVLVEKNAKQKNFLLGSSEYDIMVSFPGKEEEKGEILPIRITGIKGTTLLGEKWNG